MQNQMIDQIEEMLQRRMTNTGESKAEASAHIAEYLKRIVKTKTK